MRIKLTAIGNSRGVRLPKAVLEECQAGEGFDLEVRDGVIILRPVRGLRSGWEERFRALAAGGGERLLDPETATRFDRDEWQW